MEDEIKKYLQDILSATDEITMFFDGKEMRFAEFETNMMLRRAVERNIEIIGEAMNRVLKADPSIAITNARKIVDARNYIIHGYDRLSTDILWSIVVNHIPLLRSEVFGMLGGAQNQ